MLHDFWYKAQKKAKKYMRESELQAWNNMAV